MTDTEPKTGDDSATWLLRLRRAYGVPEFVTPANAEAILAGEVAPAFRVTQLSPGAWHDAATELIRTIVEQAARGDLDGDLVPSEIATHLRGPATGHEAAYDVLEGMDLPQQQKMIVRDQIVTVARRVVEKLRTQVEWEQASLVRLGKVPGRQANESGENDGA